MGSPTAERGITTCWQYLGYHVYSAGPCFDKMQQAIDYRDRLDYAGLTWLSQNDPWPPASPEGWTLAVTD